MGRVVDHGINTATNIALTRPHNIDSDGLDTMNPDCIKYTKPEVKGVRYRRCWSRMLRIQKFAFCPNRMHRFEKNGSRKRRQQPAARFTGKMTLQLVRMSTIKANFDSGKHTYGK